VAGFKPALAIPKEQNIQHYTIGEWVDFGRGLLTGTRSAETHEHAATCKACGELASYTARLAGVCRAMPSEEAPAGFAQRAYAIFQDSRK